MLRTEKMLALFKAASAEGLSLDQLAATEGWNMRKAYDTIGNLRRNHFKITRKDGKYFLSGKERSVKPINFSQINPKSVLSKWWELLKQGNPVSSRGLEKKVRTQLESIVWKLRRSKKRIDCIDGVYTYYPEGDKYFIKPLNSKKTKEFLLGKPVLKYHAKPAGKKHDYKEKTPGIKAPVKALAPRLINVILIREDLVKKVINAKTLPPDVLERVLEGVKGSNALFAAALSLADRIDENRGIWKA